MRHTFSRINPNATMRAQYRAYQAIAVDRQGKTLQPELPTEVQHIQDVQVLPVWGNTPEQQKPKAVLNHCFEHPGLLSAAGNLALELEERARWLAQRGEVITDKITGNGRTRTHGLESVVPLVVTGNFTDVRATVGLYSELRQVPKQRERVAHLGYLSIVLQGTNTAVDEQFSTYAGISSNVINLAHPETAGSPPKFLDGSLLVDAFELRDMLTFVENAPDAALPQQRYPSHVMHDPVPSAPVAS
jgi:hypothetical protein